MGKIKWVFFVIVLLTFVGCSGVEPSPSFYIISIESANKRAYFKHYSILPPEIKQGEVEQWKFVRTQTTDLFTFDLRRKNDGVLWLGYGLQVTPRNAENYKVRLGLFDKERTLGFNKWALMDVEAIKKQDKEYLIKEYATTEGFKSARYTTVNHYPAIEVETYKTTKIAKNYEVVRKKTFYIFSYSKTGKLKQYVIELIFEGGNPDSEELQLKSKYTFEDMLQRVQRSLDSFTPSDEDFGPDEVSG